MPDQPAPPTVQDTIFNLQQGSSAFTTESAYGRLKFLEDYSKPTPIEGMQFSLAQLRKIIRSI